MYYYAVCLLETRPCDGDFAVSVSISISLTGRSIHARNIMPKEIKDPINILILPLH